MTNPQAAPSRKQEPEVESTSISPDEQVLADKFSVTVKQIRDAIEAVGRNQADVEMYLKGSHSSTDAETTRKAP